jgi:hypothetical protein
MLILLLLQEAEIEKLVERLGEDDLRSRSATGDALLKHGKAALPALNRVLEKSPTDEVKHRAEWLIDRIVGDIVEELRKKYDQPRDDDDYRCGRTKFAEADEKLAKWFPRARVVQWSSGCM